MDSYFLLWLEKKKKRNNSQPLSPPSLGLYSWCNDSGNDLRFWRSTFQDMHPHLMWEASTFKPQQRNKPHMEKEDAAWVYFHLPVLHHTSSKAGCSPFSPGENITIKKAEWKPSRGSTSTEKQNLRYRNTWNPKLILHYNMDRRKCCWKPTHALQITWKTVRDGQSSILHM